MVHAGADVLPQTAVHHHITREHRVQRIRREYLANRGFDLWKRRLGSIAHHHEHIAAGGLFERASGPDQGIAMGHADESSSFRRVARLAIPQKTLSLRGCRLATGIASPAPPITTSRITTRLCAYASARLRG